MTFVRSSLIAFAVTCAAGAALADTDPMANFYANTMTSTHPDGVYNVYFNKDHTYKVTHDGKIVRAGNWTYENKKLCMTYDNEQGKGKGLECPPFNADLQIGQTWDAVNEKGQHDPLSLIAGRKE